MRSSQLALSRPSRRANTRGLAQRQRDLLASVHALTCAGSWVGLGAVRRSPLSPPYDDYREALDALHARGLLSRRERKGPGRGRYQYRYTPISERPT